MTDLKSLVEAYVDVVNRNCPAMELKSYTCHKRVRAAEIMSVTISERSDCFRNVTVVTGEVEGFPPEMFSRYFPKPGDFLVVYEDGYRSFSPRKAFLEGYTESIDESIMMERLNDLARTKAADVVPKWLAGLDWTEKINIVAREAYVTINSLKFQLEQAKKALQMKADAELLRSYLAVIIEENKLAPKTDQA